jgi:hypothetical protein
MTSKHDSLTFVFGLWLLNDWTFGILQRTAMEYKVAITPNDPIHLSRDHTKRPDSTRLNCSVESDRRCDQSIRCDSTKPFCWVRPSGIVTVITPNDRWFGRLFSQWLHSEHFSSTRVQWSRIVRCDPAHDCDLLVKTQFCCIESSGRMLFRNCNDLETIHALCLKYSTSLSNWRNYVKHTDQTLTKTW